MSGCLSIDFPDTLPSWVWSAAHAEPQARGACCSRCGAASTTAFARQNAAHAGPCQAEIAGGLRRTGLQAPLTLRLAGSLRREKVIPEATAWFTGEALMDYEASPSGLWLLCDALSDG